MKTAALLAFVALLLPTGAAAAVAVTVAPSRAAVGEPITISGPPGGGVSLESLERAEAPVALGLIGPGPTLTAKVPELPRGDYRVVVAGSREAPVLTIVAPGSETLSQETSIALIAFGLLFILVVLVGGVVLHRRWRDAIS